MTDFDETAYKHMIAEQLSIEPSQVTMESTFSSLGAYQEDMVELSMTYEEEFGVALPDAFEDISEPTITVEHVKEYVLRHFATAH